MADERSRDKKEKLTAGVDSLERNGLATITEIYRLNCSINQFYRIIRNRFYCGMVKVPGLEDEKEFWVRGIQEAIVSEPLFDFCQNVLNRRKGRQTRKRIQSDMMLRGFFCCPKCGKRLTGSRSRGRMKRYAYYHCRSSCGFRFRADKVNQGYKDCIAKFTVVQPYSGIYADLLGDFMKRESGANMFGAKIIVKSIQNLMTRIFNARMLLEKGEIDSDDLNLIKSDCERRISVLEREIHNNLLTAKNRDYKLSLMKYYFEHPIELFERLDAERKQHFIALTIRNDTALKSHLQWDEIVVQSVAIIYGIKNAESEQRVCDEICFYNEYRLRNTVRESMASRLKKYHTEHMANQVISYMLEYFELTRTVFLAL